MSDIQVLAANDGGVALTAFMVVGFVIFFVWVIINDARKTKERQRIWAEIAEQFGLAFSGKFDMSGFFDGFHVHADIYTTGSGKNRTTWTRVRISGGLTPNLSLGREGFLSQLVGSDVQLGDPRFDDAVKVKGPESLALALLDDATRNVVRLAVHNKWAFEDGTWTFRTGGAQGEEVRRHIEAGLDLARLIRDGQAQLAARLAERVESDPSPRTRRRALESLLEEYARAPETLRAVMAARADQAAEVRLIAARHLGDVELLDALSGDAAHAVPLRVAAFEALVAREPTHSVTVERAAAWAMGREAQGLLMRRAAVRALAVVPAPDAERMLLSALEDKDDDLKFDAIGSLGAVGTIQAVPALIPHRDKLLAFRLKGAAKDAILAIQARATGADAGALALAGDGGGLAFAESGEELDH